tara:strand:+ start:8306 stop:8725 length:420 start_codon:yes stop_codon:yes gene_type:complete
MKTPAKKPKRAPRAALKAPFLFSLLMINSPINAPRKGPIIKPNGPRNKRPKINPILLPYTLPIPPPKFFAPKLGMKLSKINIAKAIQKLKIKKEKSIGMVGTKLKIKTPNQAVIGPGITGRKLPAIPNRIKDPDARINK